MRKRAPAAYTLPVRRRALPVHILLIVEICQECLKGHVLAVHDGVQVAALQAVAAAVGVVELAADAGVVHVQQGFPQIGSLHGLGCLKDLGQQHHGVIAAVGGIGDRHLAVLLHERLQEGLLLLSGRILDGIRDHIAAGKQHAVGGIAGHLPHIGGGKGLGAVDVAVIAQLPELLALNAVILRGAVQQDAVQVRVQEAGDLTGEVGIAGHIVGLQNDFNIRVRQLWVKDSYLDSLFSANGYPNIYLVRKLHDRQDWSDAGTLILMISELEIERIYSSYVSDQQSLFILGRDMQTVSSIDNLQVRSFPEDVQTQLLSYSGSFSPAGLEQVGLITYYTIGSPQWKLVYCHDTASILHPFESSHFQYLLLMAVCLVVSVILTTLVVRHYISPIKTLREQMDEVQKGNLDSHLPITANNEIGQLTAHFNLMQDSINLLMQRLVEESEAKRSAEIKALQSQINPHFLYNTLASLRFMIFSGDKERADNIVVSLIHLMKNALSNSQRFVTIDMELRLLDDYIRIQQYTFAHPFAVEIDVTAEVRRCYTIKLLLQPIVENAIFHGLKPKATDCLLQIVGRCGGDCVDLYIRDNGVGFDPEQTAPKASPISTGIGLSNVNERIHLHFGKHYGAHITSAPGAGTEVHIHLPKLKEEEDCKPYEDSDR